MGWNSLAILVLAASVVGQAPAPRKPVRRATGSWINQLSDPRRLVPLIFASVVVVGAGRKLRQSWRAKRGAARLLEADVSLEEIKEAADHGRTTLAELFELQGTAKEPSQRLAAGHALSVLWAKDELIPEEEKSIVRRGYQVDWGARKRYPRALRIEIPIVVNYGVSFLREDGKGVSPLQLSWSHKIEGARRASLESFSPFVPGAGHAEFTIFPGDFATNGPHRLVLQSKVKTSGLTDQWEFELPHIPFSFEFDPQLSTGALLALPDESRAETFAHSARLVNPPRDPPIFLPLNDGLAIRGVPAIELDTPLPCDLAHQIELEFDGFEGWHPAGALVVSGQGAFIDKEPSTHHAAIGPLSSVSTSSIDRPGAYRVRARLLPSPERGWADPDVRSIWPETIETGWIDVEVVRR